MEVQLVSFYASQSAPAVLPLQARPDTHVANNLSSQTTAPLCWVVTAGRPRPRLQRATRETIAAPATRRTRLDSSQRSIDQEQY